MAMVRFRASAENLSRVKRAPRPWTGLGIRPEASAPRCKGGGGRERGQGHPGAHPAYSVMRLASSVQAAVELAEKTR